MKSSEVLVAFVCLALASARPRQHHAGPFHPYFTEPVRYFPDPSAGPWMVPGSSPSARAKALLAKMNLTEKVDMLHGAAGPYVGNIVGNKRLNIPPILMNDGPQGFRASEDGTSTQWPSGLTMAASFDVAALQAWGVAMGQEFRDKGANVQLGPGLCVARVPVNGRNFEYLSGEDPFLGATMVVPAVKGIQSMGVIANAKHFILNNEETNRYNVSDNADERTMWEIYLTPFQAAVDAGVLSVMCSYNRINGIHACQNPNTMDVDLKQRMDFQGWVMSDWFATHSTVDSALAGLDQEMPVGQYFGSNLLAAVKNGSVSESLIDDKMFRILRGMFAIGVFDRPLTGNVSANVTSVAHNQLARDLAGRTTVLLKNDESLLPLDSGSLKSIAVVGSAAHDAVISGGGGSGAVAPPYQISGLQGITNRAGSSVNVTYTPTGDVSAAVAAAKAADVVIAFTATTSSEGVDRKNLSLPVAETALIDAVSKANAKSVVVVVTPGAVLLPYSDDVTAILTMFMPGQEEGNAIADILFGKVNPSAKLPLTYPNKENEVGFSPSQYPGLPTKQPLNADYTEKLEVGYRWYNAHNVTPKYCFGHGLSYTSFAYSNLVIRQGGTGGVATISASVQNNGTVSGAEAVQLYLTFPTKAGEPPLQLKGIVKVSLVPRETAHVTFDLDSRSVSTWDVNTHTWAPQSGVFGVHVGSSSCDIRLLGSVSL